VTIIQALALLAKRDHLKDIKNRIDKFEIKKNSDLPYNLFHKQVIPNFKSKIIRND
jgi:hypothetical protein